MSYYVQDVQQLSSFIQRIRPEDRNFLVVICGPPLSGKTYLTNQLLQELKKAGVSLPTVDDKPFLFEEGRFYRPDLRKFLERTGNMFLHPKVVNVPRLKELVDRILQGKRIQIIRTEPHGGRIIRKELSVLPPRNGVVVVEGNYVCDFLKDMADLSIFINIPSRMEIILRRIVRAAYGLTTEGALEYMSYSQVLWDLFGEGQRKEADVIYMNDYRVLEDIGREDYQLKVCIKDFSRQFPEIYQDLTTSKPLYMEDVVVSEGAQRIRGRLIYRDGTPNSFKISYRRFVPDEFPYIRRISYEFSPRFFLPFTIALRSSGLPIKGIKREIKWITNGDIKYKLYEDRGVVEIETGRRELIERFIDIFKGKLIFRSYYTSQRLCGG